MNENTAEKIDGSPIGLARVQISDAVALVAAADKKLARELREDAGMLLAQLCFVMDRAAKAGLTMAFQVKPDARGLHQPSPISVTRAL